MMLTLRTYITVSLELTKIVVISDDCSMTVVVIKLKFYKQ